MTPPPSHGQNAVPVELNPEPGYCIKTRVQPDGQKLFINICHDPAVPSAEGHLPLVLSERRDGTDKAGQPCIIFDAIFNTGVYHNAVKDTKLRSTLIDVALSRIEEVAGFTLSRSFITPNIKSKGAIPPKAARIPAFWASAHPSVREPKSPSVPTWSWSPTRDGCRIVIQVPELTKELHESSTLDIEARRLIFVAGSVYHLDTLLLPPAKSEITKAGKPTPVGSTTFLPTTVDPDSAIAEWNVKNKQVAITIKWASVAAREKEKAK
ncbi:PIH1 domain-containing protein 1 [Ceratobasidium theobromae]|uniref:PIH1 domain-containing protein 1 n=1 Tax=Ceratobasidium theobromae TaxID=1582974 RepID=A0A5N5QRF1_9AGAM|nr:PIH1 domain-containing protein 1 [Ceratobasidium theobromae]